MIYSLKLLIPTYLAGATTCSKVTFSITTLCITIRKCATQHNDNDEDVLCFVMLSVAILIVVAHCAECHYAECPSATWLSHQKASKLGCIFAR